jgi:ubiquinone/menaquinone biosynthesis C-methylase UbiE
MTNNEKIRRLIEDTGKHYNEIIFEDDFIPSKVYLHQISLRDRIIENLLGEQNFTVVLDLGCGTGFHQETLSRYAGRLIGADMSFGALKVCKRNFSGEYIVCDVNQLPFKNNSIDLIWIAGVLHHVPDRLPPVIKNITSILRPGGVLLVDEPNKLNPLNYFILKFSKADPTGSERSLSSASIKKLFRDCHLKILSSDWYEFLSPFGLMTGNDHIFRLCERGDALLGRSFIRPFLLRWTIHAIKE